MLYYRSYFAGRVKCPSSLGNEPCLPALCHEVYFQNLKASEKIKFLPGTDDVDGVESVLKQLTWEKMCQDISNMHDLVTAEVGRRRRASL